MFFQQNLPLFCIKNVDLKLVLKEWPPINQSADLVVGGYRIRFIYQTKKNQWESHVIPSATIFKPATNILQFPGM